MTLLIVALIFGVLNAIIKPIFALFTPPLILLTLGLFLIVINACMFCSLHGWPACLISDFMSKASGLHCWAASSSRS